MGQKDDPGAVLADCLKNMERVMREVRDELLTRIALLRKEAKDCPRFQAGLDELRDVILGRLR